MLAHMHGPGCSNSTIALPNLPALSSLLCVVSFTMHGQTCWTRSGFLQHSTAQSCLRPSLQCSVQHHLDAVRTRQKVAWHLCSHKDCTSVSLGAHATHCVQQTSRCVILSGSSCLIFKLLLWTCRTSMLGYREGNDRLQWLCIIPQMNANMRRAIAHSSIQSSCVLKPTSSCAAHPRQHR